MNNNNRNTLVLYSSAICNLNCTYCYIDKNPALAKIDQILLESFKGDYYLEQSKKFFDKHKLERVEIWGGEPSLHYIPILNTIQQLIEYYPNLNQFMTSTNFTTEDWFDQFYQFLDILKLYNRKFIFDLQLSIDGPPEINDINRGEGTTEKFIQHFSHMLATIGEHLPKNVELSLFFKPTYDGTSIRNMQSKEKIIKYFQFFEKFKTASLPVEVSYPNFNFTLTVPNTACPSPHTKEEGILFANYCKMTREIEKENKEKHYFNFYNSITSFVPRGFLNPEELRYYNFGNCGTGTKVLGLLPNNCVSVCHNGFCDMISDYKIQSMKKENLEKHTIDFQLFNQNSNVQNLCIPEDKYYIYDDKASQYFDQKQIFQSVSMVSTIQMLARFHQIDDKYQDREEALKASKFIMDSTSYCIRDHIGTSGSMIVEPLGLYKLLLNGAREYILYGV